MTALRASIDNVVSHGITPVKNAVADARQSARDLENQAQTLYKC